jgi:hypothetical protein
MGTGGKEDVDFVESYSELEKLVNLLSVPVTWLRSPMNTAAAQNRKKTSRTSTFCWQPFLSVWDTSHKGFGLKRTAFAIQIDLTDNTMV